MNWLEPSIGLAGSALVIGSLLVLHRWRRLLPEDPPGGRKRHAHSLPMAGVALGLLAAGTLGLLVSPLAGLSAAIATGIGYLDDRRKHHGGLPVAVKVPGLLLSAGLAVGATTTGGLPWTTLALAVGFAFVVTNALNFLDNTDGVSAAVGGLGLVLASDGAGPAALVGFAFLGFLPWNWPRPRALLGDAGSLSLGACLAWVALQRALDGSTLSWAAALAPVVVPIADFVQVVCARLWLGFAPWIGDRRHLAHIAMNTGLPRAMVAPVFAGAAALLYGVLA